MHHHTIVSIHGIKTRGSWQKSLTTILSKNKNYTHIPYDYDYFYAFQMLFNGQIQKKVKEFIEFYLSNKLNEKTPSIVAHSFGSKIIFEAIKSEPKINLNKLMLFGSVLKDDVEVWEDLFDKGRLNEVRNIFCPKDYWVKLASLTPHYGNLGMSGSACNNKRFSQEEITYGNHSSQLEKTFLENHIDTFFKRNIFLHVSNEMPLKNLLKSAVHKISSSLSSANTMIRASIFLPDFSNKKYVMIMHHGHFINDEIMIRIPFESENIISKTFNTKIFCLFDIANEHMYSINNNSIEVDINPNIDNYLLDYQISMNEKIRWILAIPIIDNQNSIGTLILEILSYDAIAFPQISNIYHLKNKIEFFVNKMLRFINYNKSKEVDYA